MKSGNTLWIVALVSVAWLTFLLGYAVASLTQTEAAAAGTPPAAVQPVSGGYGK